MRETDYYWYVSKQQVFFPNVFSGAVREKIQFIDEQKNVKWMSDFLLGCRKLEKTVFILKTSPKMLS